ncbi:MAG: hypothetical protein H6877_10395 [Rhodobiaceae bacterium]|nr:hypothetical protein [Rhodobiaceae bacterium]
MAGKREKPEETVSKLRQVEVLQGQGMTIADAVRQIGTTQQTYYIYGRLSRCKGDIDLATWIRCKHLSGVSRPKVGAPKWGIRMRAPLQLVGLKGRDNSQARRAPVRSGSPFLRRLAISVMFFRLRRGMVRPFEAQPR